MNGDAAARPAPEADDRGSDEDNDDTGGAEPDSSGDENAPNTDSPADTNDDDSEPSDDTDGTDSSALDSTDTDDVEEPMVDPGRTGAAIVPRLTQAELSHVLEDVLGDASGAVNQFIAEDEFSPYDNDSLRQTVSASLVDSLQALAEDVAARVAHDMALRAQFMPCEPADASDAECFDRTSMALGRAFLRRALTDDEVTAYRTLLEYAEEQGDFYAAIELLLSALIQDPEFLYRMERGSPSSADPNVLELTGNEIATRMAFLLLGSTPSPELLDAEATLGDAEQRRSLAAAMLQQDRAHQQLYRFHAMWLGYRALPHDAELNDAFQHETEQLIERVVFTEPSDYIDLFRSPETYLTTALAEHYGLPLPEGGEGWVTYPEESGRAGILSHGSVLSAFSKFSDTSPTQRGILVRTRLLCLAVPPPPPTVNVDQEPGENTSECKTDRYRAHREQSGCSDCHNLFEPIGMGLENFDRAGRYREHDDDNENCTIPGAGTLPSYGDFSGPKELSALLVDAGVIDDCFVRQYLAFASSKSTLNADDEAYAAQLTDNLAGHQGRLEDWLLDLVAAPSFAQRLRQEGQ